MKYLFLIMLCFIGLVEFALRFVTLLLLVVSFIGIVVLVEYNKTKILDLIEPTCWDFVRLEMSK